MNSLSSLRPALLWRFFQQICAIPHPSTHETALRDWIIHWADTERLMVQQDRIGNLIIRKPATVGREDCPGIILQAHLDMVPQKNADIEHDFLSDPIEAYIDGDWVTARGTTLGADNGIGMAACLAVLASDNLDHGPLEVLLTTDEEAGMTGAFGLEPGLLQGAILLNTDSEQEGEVYMGCAGGVDANIRLSFVHEPVPDNYQAFRLELNGLRGGHSGCDIHRGRGNANQLLTRLLRAIETSCDLRLVSFDGGSLRNAIPREAAAVLLVPVTHIDQLRAVVQATGMRCSQELAAVEQALNLVLTPITAPAAMMDRAAQKGLLEALTACPDGVIRMSDNIAGVVETSINLGVVSTRGSAVTVQCLIRSLRDAGREHVEQMLTALFGLAGAEVNFDGAYPGWQPDNDSAALAVVQQAYQDLFDRRPEVMVIHAGLECGLFKSAYPHWDMVSFGPTIRFPHSPDEQVHIGSVDRFWQLLVAVLARMTRNDPRNINPAG